MLGTVKQKPRVRRNAERRLFQAIKIQVHAAVVARYLPKTGVRLNHSTFATVRSSKRIGVPEYGMPQTPARPAIGAVLTACAIIQLAGSVVPCFHALPSNCHLPSVI